MTEATGHNNDAGLHSVLLDCDEIHGTYQPAIEGARSGNNHFGQAGGESQHEVVGTKRKKKSFQRKKKSLDASLDRPNPNKGNIRHQRRFSIDLYDSLQYPKQVPKSVPQPVPQPIPKPHQTKNNQPSGQTTILPAPTLPVPVQTTARASSSCWLEGYNFDRETHILQGTRNITGGNSSRTRRSRGTKINDTKGSEQHRNSGVAPTEEKKEEQLEDSALSKGSTRELKAGDPRSKFSSTAESVNIRSTTQEVSPTENCADAKPPQPDPREKLVASDTAGLRTEARGSNTQSFAAGEFFTPKEEDERVEGRDTPSVKHDDTIIDDKNKPQNTGFSEVSLQKRELNKMKSCEDNEISTKPLLAAHGREVNNESAPTIETKGEEQDAEESISSSTELTSSSLSPDASNQGVKKVLSRPELILSAGGVKGKEIGVKVAENDVNEVSTSRSSVTPELLSNKAGSLLATETEGAPARKLRADETRQGSGWDDAARSPRRSLFKPSSQTMVSSTSSGSNQEVRKENSCSNEEQNPQEATSVQSTREPVKSSTDVEQNTQASNATQPTDNRTGGPISPRLGNEIVPKVKRSRRRRRIGAFVAMEADAASKKTFSDVNLSMGLPPNQYETTLRRRAIRKKSPPSSPRPSASNQTSLRRSVFGDRAITQGAKLEDGEYGDEIEGDVSLGMKLTIIAGCVIVQSLKPLDDGRASPAQLTGLINRGDVLLAINGNSLVNLPIDRMVDGLKPLSSADDGGDLFQRTLKLRFAVAEGLELLAKNDRQTKAASSDRSENIDAAAGMFTLAPFMPQDIPMVDQLSGMPLFSEETMFKDKKAAAAPVKAERVEVTPPNAVKKKESISLNKHISVNVQNERRRDLQQNMSGFYTLNDLNSCLLRSASGSLDFVLFNGQKRDDKIMTHAQIVAQGKRSIKGAKQIFYQMDDKDNGKDDLVQRRYDSAKSIQSFRSRASSKKRFALKHLMINEDDSANESTNASGQPEEMPELDGKALMEKAATDTIWKEELIRALKGARKEIENDREAANSPDKPKEQAPEMNFDFLFGAQVTQMLTRKNNFSLPPADVTFLISDLTAHLSVSTPGEITLQGPVISHQETTVADKLLRFRQSGRVETEFIKAAEFLVETAFPSWLESFQPLPWEQRRALFPLRSFSHDLTGSGTSFQDDITVSVDSGGTGRANPQHEKDLQAQVEEMELDSETRIETCYLVTFYFTDYLLPMETSSREKGDGNSSYDDRAVKFLKKYGAYVKLHTSLVAAMRLMAKDVIGVLLSIAKHDLHHMEAMKQISRPHSLIFYEPALLSAIIKLMAKSVEKRKNNGNQGLLSLIVSAYPDLRPWYVKHEFCGVEGSIEIPQKAWTPATLSSHQDLYYEYLSLLLHPSDGHDEARHIPELVQDWCELSVADAINPSSELPDASRRLRHQNFYSVASSAYDESDNYFRDLPMLMGLSMSIKGHNLALDLGEEIIGSQDYCGITTTMDEVVSNLCSIAKFAVQNMKAKKSESSALFQRVLVLLDRAAQKWLSIDIASMLIQLCSSNTEGQRSLEDYLLALVTETSSPRTVTKVMLKGINVDPNLSTVLPRLQRALTRGAQEGLHTELSGSLLRLRQERGIDKYGPPSQIGPEDSSLIWRKMFTGTAIIAK